MKYGAQQQKMSEGSLKCHVCQQKSSASCTPFNLRNQIQKNIQHLLEGTKEFSYALKQYTHFELNMYTTCTYTDLQYAILKFTNKKIQLPKIYISRFN